MWRTFRVHALGSTGRTCQAELDALLGLGLPGLDSTAIPLLPTVCRMATPLPGGRPTVASAIEAITTNCCGGAAPCANPCARPGDYNPDTAIETYW